MKFLCICNHGRVRSRLMAVLLTENYHDAIARGWQQGRDNSVKEDDYKWADKIVILSENQEAFDNIPESYRTKVINSQMEPDRWFDNRNAELREIMRRKINTLGVPLERDG